MRVNGEGAGYVAEIAAELRAPLVHLSTDYVFDGALDRPYREDDATAPAGAYGRSKLVGEQRIAAIHPNSAILRTSWIYSPFGENFVKTMLALGETASQAKVVADQRGNPTYALDIADVVFAIADRLRADPSPELRGVFHLSGRGEATWAEFAEAIFAEAVAYGRAPVSIKPIASADYPTAARRLTNSRLDNAKIAAAFGVSLPHWRHSTKLCVARLLAPRSRMRS
jgi:dTDP-4-dehydrorhamnose reductase